jgi:sialate O-acetylesterase
MILEWRRQWQRNLAFGIVQLPRMGKASMEPADSLWAELRESQTKALELPNTALAVMIDSGDNDNLHPWNKRLTGHRLFTAVLGKIYQKQKVYTGPSFKNAEFSDGKAVIEFDHTGSGLIARSFDIEVATAPDGTPMDKEYIIKGFTIAGKDRVFHPASAKITNNKITVWSPDVKAPQAVRYAWNDNPDGLNLFNLEGFPVAPFRTDNWPVLTNNSQLKR